MSDITYKPVNVFVYGTLKSGYGNNRLLARADLVGEATTAEDNFTMINGGFPWSIPNGKFFVKGELYSVKDQLTLDNLDRLEGTPTMFSRYYTSFKTADGTIHEGFMYVASEKNREYLLKNGEKITPNDDNICEWSR